jgi:uncharacterized protein YndB with AHSA1/START domain
MTTTAMPTTDTPVQQTITVRASLDRTFRVFTAEFDSWWPRSHHIGSSPMKRAIIEGHVGGKCYSEQEDGTDCPWGTVLLWEPPHRFVFAWQVTPQWTYEPDLEKASEVEIRFTDVGEASTRVDLEHRHFNRHGEGADGMRTGVGGPDGWNALLKLFAEQAEKA